MTTKQDIINAGLPIVDFDGSTGASFSRELTQAEWMTFLNLVNPIEHDKQNAVIKYKTYPDWVRKLTAENAENYINSQVWNGMTVDQTRAYIDANVKDLATARTAMKQIAGAVINLRGLFILIAKLVICIRDISIRKTGE